MDAKVKDHQELVRRDHVISNTSVDEYLRFIAARQQREEEINRISEQDEKIAKLEALVQSLLETKGKK